MDLRNKSVFLTGAASGIGREIAKVLARAGADVVATDVDLPGLESLKKEVRDSAADIHIFGLNVADAEAYEQLVNRLCQGGFAPDILINNAGVGYLGSLFDTPPEVWDRLLRINILGVVTGCRIFGPRMAKAGGERLIVNVASAASASPAPNMSAYAATKWAVEGLSDVLAMELDGTPLRVLTVHPGIIDTPIVRDVRGVSPSLPPGQVEALQRHYRAHGCHPRIVAEAIADAICAGQDKLFVGPMARTSAWMRRLAPVRLKRRLTISNARRVGYLSSNANLKKG